MRHHLSINIRHKDVVVKVIIFILLFIFLTECEQNNLYRMTFSESLFREHTAYDQTSQLIAIGIF